MTTASFTACYAVRILYTCDVHRPSHGGGCSARYRFATGTCPRPINNFGCKLCGVVRLVTFNRFETNTRVVRRYITRVHIRRSYYVSVAVLCFHFARARIMYIQNSVADIIDLPSRDLCMSKNRIRYSEIYRDLLKLSQFT